MSSESLNVIALISGGKDSFFNIIHCIHHGHRIVALANLFPVSDNSLTNHGNDDVDVDVDDDDGDGDGHVQFIDPAIQPIGLTPDGRNDASQDEPDLNSFMYQTVGHEVVPLYAAATGLPLYRQPIRGAAVHHERDYAFGTDVDNKDEEEEEETESMIPLLRFIKSRHPEANAICSGAILSTYQRTRVESIALRLGLTPLAYLWKYTLLPPPSDGPTDEAQLLRDMAAAGLEARIIKVASAGLDERHLWERVSSDVGVQRIQSALRKFGATEGAALGEGGEFETIVLDGPSRLFKRRITVPDDGRIVVREGGGSNWLMLRGARLQEKPLEAEAEAEADLSIRVPDLLDSTFQSMLERLSDSQSIPVRSQAATPNAPSGPGSSAIIDDRCTIMDEGAELLRWPVIATLKNGAASIESETRSVVESIRALLSEASLDAERIATTLIILRNMADFPKVNAEYGKLFTRPNPPSRITISCGDLLPDGHNIMIYVTVPHLKAKCDRDGLHVQSRSYWAPANIGPYSQAIDVAVTAGWEPTGVRNVYVAGQIPLLPASMALPPPPSASAITAGDAAALQVTLSLQHLWRIGVEMKIQLWTSAVAYFAKTSSVLEMERNAKMAGLAWSLAHTRPEGATEDEDEDEDEGGPDLWDLKFNPKYMTLGGGGGEQYGQQRKTGSLLPDWSVIAPRRHNEMDSCVPPFFAAEVEELPRQSTVEWHAHTGLSRIGQGHVELIHHDKLKAPGWEAQHVIVRSEGANLVYTVLSQGFTKGAGGDGGVHNTRETVAALYHDSIRLLGVVKALPGSAASDTPYLAYVDATEDGMSHWTDGGVDGGVALPCAVVPCRSIWSMSGTRIRCVALFRLTLRHARTTDTTGTLDDS